MKKTVFLTAVAMFLHTTTASAEQLLSADDKSPQRASITKNSLSRISISGGRILRTRYIDSELEVEEDKKAGQIYVRALTNRPSSMFITADNDKTYLVILAPTAKEADSIVIDALGAQNQALRAAAAIPPPPRAVTTKSSEYIRSIKQIMMSMMSGTAESMGVHSSMAYETVPLWQGVLFVKTKHYTAADMQADAYNLTNTSSDVISLREQEFYKPGVYAIVIRKHILQPGEGTEVFIARRLGGI